MDDEAEGAPKRRTASKLGTVAGLVVGWAVVPTTAKEQFSQYRPRTAEAWRKMNKQRRAIIPLEQRLPSIIGIAVACGFAMVRTQHGSAKRGT